MSPTYESSGREKGPERNVSALVAALVDMLARSLKEPLPRAEAEKINEARRSAVSFAKLSSSASVVSFALTTLLNNKHTRQKQRAIQLFTQILADLLTMKKHMDTVLDSIYALPKRDESKKLMTAAKKLEAAFFYKTDMLVKQAMNGMDSANYSYKEIPELKSFKVERTQRGR